MSTWLVTGGAGFIGSHIVEELLEHGEKVVILDNLSTGKPSTLRLFGSRARFIRGDIRNPSAVRRALRGIRFVSHQAALRSVPRSIDDPLGSNEVNVTGTLTLLWEALKARVQRVVYASSSSVYGDSGEIPQSEAQRPSPVSPYAVSKLAGEHYCRVFAKTFGLETASLRYFNVFGPRQDPRSRYAAVIPIFMKAAREGKPLPVEGDGRQSRDFTFVKNVARANRLAARAPRAAGESFNIACGESHSVIELAREVSRLSGRPLSVRRKPPRIGDVRRTFADVSKARRLLGLKGLVTFRQGLALTWQAFK